MSNIAVKDIRDDLKSISEDIPQYIRTGVPENVKSPNMRSLALRNNTAVMGILDLVESQLGSGSVIAGNQNPNEAPPSSFSIGQLYLRQDEAAVNKELYMFTGIDELGWWRMDKANDYKIAYGSDADPNASAPKGTFKIGDYYVYTSTGDSSGDVLSVWFFSNAHDGKQWIGMGEQFSYLTGTLTLLQEGLNADMRVWSAYVLSKYIAGILESKDFNISNEVKITDFFEVNFLDEQDVEAAVDLLALLKNWDITWTEETAPDTFIHRSLKQEYIYIGKGPLVLKYLIDDPLKPDQLYLKGEVDEVGLQIPANAKFTIW